MFILSGILWLACQTGIDRADWPQWRGPARDGVWPDGRMPQAVPPGGFATLWRRPIGGGYGGIAVTHGRVLVLDRILKPHEVERLWCLDATTGAVHWKYEYPVDYHKMDYGNGPRATPTVHGGTVTIYGAVGHLHCLSIETGKVHWQRDTVAELGGRIPTWGHASSPLVDGDRLIVHVGGKENACLVAFDRRTGNPVWRTLSDRPGYASPVAIEVAGQRQIVIWTPEHAVGVRPDNGQVLWKVPYASTYDVSISDPIWHEGVLLVSGYWEGSKAFRLVDGTKPSMVWEGKRLSLLMSTPLVRDGFVYALDKKDGLKCIELATGQVRWEGEQITPRGRNPQASLVWASQEALILNEKGELILARLSPKKYEQVWKTTVLPEGTWAHPAYANGCIFVRNDQEIVCVRLVGPK